MKPSNHPQGDANSSASPLPTDVLAAGTHVKSHNESPVAPSIIELEPYLRVIKATRSSNIYEKFE